MGYRFVAYVSIALALACFSHIRRNGAFDVAQRRFAAWPALVMIMIQREHAEVPDVAEMNRQISLSGSGDVLPVTGLKILMRLPARDRIERTWSCGGNVHAKRQALKRGGQAFPNSPHSFGRRQTPSPPHQSTEILGGKRHLLLQPPCKKSSRYSRASFCGASLTESQPRTSPIHHCRSPGMRQDALMDFPDTSGAAFRKISARRSSVVQQYAALLLWRFRRVLEKSHAEMLTMKQQAVR